MKSMVKKQNVSRGFTIIELLTVMSIIILLMGLFMPAMNMVRRYARRVAQHNQFHTIEVALALFNAEWEDYPSAIPTGAYNYPSGAYALARAMVGDDLLGYDPDGRYNQDDLSDRRPYLDAGNANANLATIYNSNLDPNYVLADVYPHIPHPVTGRPIGMPILYYKANVSNYYHSQSYADLGKSIYDYLDNHTFVNNIPIPKDSSGREHSLFVQVPNKEGVLEVPFYEDTRDYRTIITRGGVPVVMPYRATSYLLLSAGFDGEYGTDDDVYNFSD